MTFPALYSNCRLTRRLRSKAGESIMVTALILMMLGGLGALIAVEIVDEFRAENEPLTDKLHP